MEKIEKKIRVEQLFHDLKDDFEFELIGGAEGLDRIIKAREITRPSLGFAGYTEFFLKERVQIIGETEISFLKTLPEDIQRMRIEKLLSLAPPCFIITKRLQIPVFFKEFADRYKVPVIRTSHDTTPFMKSLVHYLEYKLAEEIYLHGTLVDVYGVGLLLTGSHGIGKSETALALVSKGHRLVADDLVKIIKRDEKYLIGMASDKIGGIQNFMEIRGVGVINVYSIFGVRAIRFSKRIDLVVEIKRWERDTVIERFGLDRKKAKILNIELPKVIIPVIPGKSISVICELVALDFLTKELGYNAPEELQRSIVERLREKSKSFE